MHRHTHTHTHTRPARERAPIIHRAQCTRARANSRWWRWRRWFAAERAHEDMTKNPSCARTRLKFYNLGACAVRQQQKHAMLASAETTDNEKAGVRCAYRQTLAQTNIRNTKPNNGGVSRYTCKHARTRARDAHRTHEIECLCMHVYIALLPAPMWNARAMVGRPARLRINALLYSVQIRCDSGCAQLARGRHVAAAASDVGVVTSNQQSL